MLQPMQPIGQQPQKPGVNMPGGMPQQPGRPQTMPAGAAQASTLLPGGITNSIQDIKNAYGSNPQRLQQAQQQGDILSAIALQQILEEQKSKKRQMELDKAKQSGQPGTIIEQKQQEAVELRRQDLEQQQAARLGVENQRSQSALAQIGQQAARPQQPQPMPRPGIAGIPAPNAAEPRAMAAGGIVAFDEGGNVNPPTNVPQVSQEAVDEYLRAHPGATIQEAQAALSARPPAKQMGLRALIEEGGRRKVGLDPAQQAAQTREEYAKYAGYSPEEKAAQEKRIAETEAYDRQAYAPERLQNEGLAAFLMGAAGKGGIGETLAGAGSSGLNYSNKMRELARQKMVDRQRQAEEFMEAQRGARVKGFEAGQTTRKETLGEQATGLKELGDLYSTDVTAATARQRIGGGAGNKALEDASQAVARDDIIGALKGKLKDEMVGSPEYNKIVAQIESRAKAIYTAFKAPYPEMPATEQAPEAPKEEPWYKRVFGRNEQARANLGIGSLGQAPAAQQAASPMPATKDQLVVGKVYNTAKGPATWDGQQFVK